MTTRMPKLPTKKYTVRFFEGDPERLEQFYPDAGYNAIIRLLVRKHLILLEEKLNRKLSNMENIDGRQLANELANELGLDAESLGDS